MIQEQRQTEPEEASMTETDRIAASRIESLETEDAYYARRDHLRRELEERGLSAVATAELRILEENCAAIDTDREEQQASEIYAENAWLRAAEYDPRMHDPREW